MPLGVDIGGTFTDFVLLADGRLTVHKAPTTPRDHAQAFMDGLAHLGGAETAGPIIHGTTVVTNTLLERSGARTALVATQGFKDILTIGRQTRPSLYALEPQRPPALIPPERCFEVPERLDATGAVVQPLDTEAVHALVKELRAQEVSSVAVCLLFSFLNPEHERAVAAALEGAGFAVSASHQVLPEFREYERASATAVNAYVAPVLQDYLTHLEERLPSQKVPLRVMQSNGGIVTAKAAKAAPLRTVLSGPAAGVVGAAYVAGVSGLFDLVTFDMGGTSTDVSLVPGRLRETTESEVAGVPLRVPMLDVHTVGAGGGSIARVDGGGALRVGPQSAGADPGPACYGISDQATVTDAQVVLGRILPEHFLGGQMPLQAERSHKALQVLGSQLDLDAAAAAAGVLRVANVEMEKALRVISIERGQDPRTFTLVAFGGAGPLHACDLAVSVGMHRVLVPRAPGVLSALGLLTADVMKDFSVTVMRPLPQEVDDAFVREIAAGFRDLSARGWDEMGAEGFNRDNVQVLTALDMRYAGQSYELVVPFDDLSTSNLAGRFHATHRERFGYNMPNEPIEVVNLRLKLLGKVQRPALLREQSSPADPSDASLGTRTVWFDGPCETTIYDRERLHAGNALQGPAIIVQMDATTAVPPGWRGRIDTVGNLILVWTA